MIKQNVQVLQLNDEKLWVRLGSQSGCAACDNGMGCGAGLFAKLIQHRPVNLELARNGLNVKVGQMLTLAFPEQLYVKLIFASYGWPLLAALAGALAGYSLGVWLQFGPFMIDAVTLSVGVLTAWSVMRLIRTQKTAETILNSLDMTICFPSSNPDMCAGMLKKPEHH